MDKFQNKYRIPSTRMQNWDYGWNAPYFVTICTAHRECYFGEIINGEMHLSEIGEIANKFFIEIPEHFPNVFLNVFVVMPNHVHGIIIIDKPYFGNNDQKNIGNNVKQNDIVKTPNLGVSTTTNEPATTGPTTNQPITTEPHANEIIINKLTDIKNNRWKPGVIGVIINQYKRICTINARKTHPGFAWQPRFYDIIIRHSDSYNRIKNYILDNPRNWDRDHFNR